jgi:hypothetical protein
VFEASGAKTVTLYVRDSQNHETQKTVTINVADPETVYVGANTVCFSPSGDFTGCPAGAQQRTASSFSSLQSYVANNRRLLLHRGETFTGGYLDLTGSTGGTVGAYGTSSGENRPLINSSGNTGIDGGPDWRMMDLRFHGNTSEWLASSDIKGNNFLMLRVLATNVMTGYGNSLAMNQLPNGVGVVDCEFHGADNAASAATMFFGAHRMLLAGNILRNVVADNGQHVVRCYELDRAVFADNDFADVETANHLIKLHANHPWTSDADYSQRIVILNNVFHGKEVWPVGIGPQNGDYDERLRDIVVEGNLFFAETNNVVCGLVIFATRNISVRNNVFSGSVNYDTGIASGLRGAGQMLSSHVTISNNTFRRGATGVSVESTTDASVRNNLLEGSGSVVSGSGYTASNNVRTSAAHFLATAPENSPLGDYFRLTSASTMAVNQGISLPGLGWDYSGAQRDAAPDVGAWELADVTPPASPKGLRVQRTE